MGDADASAAGEPEAGAPTQEYVAVVLETLISINGTKDTPVKDITISGITFRDAADITMEPWGVPSGGDWGLYRGGAIFIEGAEGVTVADNTLTRLDGNAVFVSGYTRHVNITDNEFSWIGCNPMASWGYTDENDGTDGQQPRYTYVARNYVHEFGHYQKQSSMWSNNKACLAQVEGNVVFNGPRAGINQVSSPDIPTQQTVEENGELIWPRIAEQSASLARRNRKIITELLWRILVTVNDEQGSISTTVR
jgi:hypothetical protein